MKRLFRNYLPVYLNHNRELTSSLSRVCTIAKTQLCQPPNLKVKVCDSRSVTRLHHYSTSSHTGTSTKLSLATRPDVLRDFLQDHKISRCFIVNLDGEFRVSHPELEGLCQELQAVDVDYDEHEAIFFARGSKTNCLLSVFLWRSNRGQGAGGVDLRSIQSLGELITDGNTMSKNLGIKQALAGLWASGGKCIISAPSGNEYLNPEFRQRLFEDTGEFLTSLNGCMVAGTGHGSSVTDMDAMFTQTKYVSNISAEYGGTGPMAQSTALGVVSAMEAAIDHLGLGSWMGKVVVIQGGGGVGVGIVDQLLQKGVKHVHIAECNSMRAGDIEHIFAKKADGRLTIHKVSFEDTSIFSIPCDIFSPCARSKVLNRTTIPLLDTKIICGASNSPINDMESQQMLMDKHIVYISDVVPNRMGMVKKLLEPYGRINVDKEIDKHMSREWEHSIYQTTLKILKLSEERGIDTQEAAYSLGEELSKQDHPLYPKRVHHIIKGLVDSGWHQGNDFWKEAEYLFQTPDES